MKIIMIYFYEKQFGNLEISNDLLRKVLILAHFFELEGLIWLATDQVIRMIDNPRSWSFH